jgi:hypothetical protein
VGQQRVHEPRCAIGLAAQMLLLAHQPRQRLVQRRAGDAVLVGELAAAWRAPDQMRERMSLIDTLSCDALVAVESIAGGVCARFRDDPGIEQRVRERAAAEAQCCAFLTLSVYRDGRAVVLEMTGSPEAQPAIRQMLPAA